MLAHQESGSEDAARRLSNRLSFFVEGGALAGGLPPVLSGLGSAFTKATTYRLPVVETSLGEIVSAPVNKITGAIGKQIDESVDRFTNPEASPSTFDNFVAKTTALLSPSGLLPKAKTVVTKEKEKLTTFRIKAKDNNEFTDEIFKTRDEARQAIEDLAIAKASKTKRYKEINKEIDDIASNRNRIATDQGRIKELEQERKQLIYGIYNKLLDDNFSINRVRVDGKTKRTITERIDLGKEMSLINPVIEGFLKEAEGKFKVLEKNIDQILKKREYVEQTDLTKQKILNTNM